MLSIRARLFLLLLNAHLKRTRQKQNQTVFNMDTSIPDFREEVSRSSGLFGRLPRGMGLEKTTINGVTGEWIHPRDGGTKPIILYFHGGGYVSGSARLHRPHVAKFVKASGAGAFVLDYRLAPEHRFPAALEDAVSVYQGLLAQGRNPEHVVFAGDSAGGGLCLATLLALKERQTPLPAGAVALSPWTDLACTGRSYEENARTCLSPENSSQVFSRHYCGAADPKIPLISPLYGDLEGLPPLLLFAGSRETMRDDAARFAQKAAQAGVPVDLEIGEGLFHCYPVCSGFIPESAQAMAKIGRFIKRLTRMDPRAH